MPQGMDPKGKLKGVVRHNHEWNSFINRKAEGDTARRQTFQEGMKDYSKDLEETKWVTTGTHETGITKTIAGGPAFSANVERLNRKIQDERREEDEPNWAYLRDQRTGELNTPKEPDEARMKRLGKARAAEMYGRDVGQEERHRKKFGR